MQSKNETINCFCFCSNIVTRTKIIFSLGFQPNFHAFLVVHHNLRGCHMALFPASHVVVVGGGFAGMVVANQAAHVCVFAQTKP